MGEARGSGPAGHVNDQAWVAVCEAVDEFLARNGRASPPDPDDGVTDRIHVLRVLGRQDLAAEFGELRIALRGSRVAEDGGEEVSTVLEEAADFVERLTGRAVSVASFFHPA